MCIIFVGELSDVLRSSQEQQQQQQQLAAALAAGGNRANAAAVYQLFQKYSQDPAMLQRHMLALASPKDQELARMMDASSLIYHFARTPTLLLPTLASFQFSVISSVCIISLKTVSFLPLLLLLQLPLEVANHNNIPLVLVLSQCLR